MLFGLFVEAPNRRPQTSWVCFQTNDNNANNANNANNFSYEKVSVSYDVVRTVFVKPKFLIATPNPVDSFSHTCYSCASVPGCGGHCHVEG